jgi:DnaJ like chaperone protein
MDTGKVYFLLKGRINRKTFWFASISLFILYVIANVMVESTDEAISPLGSLLMISLIWPTFAVHVKRWHDRNKSAWWYLISFIPMVGPLWVLVELGFLRGTPGANRYGFQPSVSTNTQNEYIPFPLTDLIAMFAKIAKSDGVISRAEISLIDDFFITVLRLDLQMRKEAIRIFNETKSSKVEYKVYATRFYHVHKENPEILKVVLDFLFALGMADGQLTAEEEILISQTEAIFGITHEGYAKHREEGERTQEPKSGKKKRQFYATVLGLTEDYTPEELKKAYRRLASQYHPDKVAHLGTKLQQVAEQEMKRINEAYEFLKEKYAFAD